MSLWKKLFGRRMGGTSPSVSQQPVQIEPGTIAAKVSRIICNEIGITEGSFGMNTSLEEELHLDSIEVFELVVAIEDEFSIMISDEAAEGIKTLADAVALIEQHVFGKHVGEAPNRTTSVSTERQGTPLNHRLDSFTATCLDVEYREVEDNRWFSQFKELPQIDFLRKSGKKKEALLLCHKGLTQYPDSFLFYLRAASICDELGKHDKADQILKEGLSKSLSKCSIAGELADRAFEKKNYREAIRWWITACVLQLESEIMVDRMPFLNLAYVCQPIDISDTERWLFDMADRASNEGPVRLNTEGAELRHQAARAAMASGDDAAEHAIAGLHELYK